MPKTNDLYHRHRYPKEIIGYTVWLYHRFMLSLRDVSEILAQRGILVAFVIYFLHTDLK